MVFSTYENGDIIGGRYKVLDICGGGMGHVYICHDLKYGKKYALKTFKDQLEEDGIRRFKREVLAWINLGKHPHIVQALKYEPNLDGKPYIKLEYVPKDENGFNQLSDYMTQDITLEQAIEWSIQFCQGMEHAQLRDIEIHRDIKPQNIMITPDKVLKITDFGLVRLTLEGNNSIFQKTQGPLFSTLPWMAPEQFEEAADIRSDIYSFGIVLYQIISGGSFPFNPEIKNPENPVESIIKWQNVHKNILPRPVDSPLYPLISKCLEKDPRRRYDNFTIIKKELKGLYSNITGRVGSFETTLSPESALEHYQMGLGYMELDQIDKAVIEFEKALKIYPSYTEAQAKLKIAKERMGLTYDELVQKADSFFNKRDYNESLKYYNKALKIDPSSGYIWNSKGWCLNQLRKPEEALKSFDKALEINPMHHYAWNNKGITLEDLGKPEEALLCYDNAINLNKWFDWPWFNKGLALSDLGRYDEAINCFDKATDINPDYFKAFNSKGFALMKLGKNYEALKYFERALEINPEYDLAKRNKELALSRNLGGKKFD